MSKGKVFIVEHLDEELEPWSALEYAAIACESQTSGSSFVLSSLPASFQIPEALSGNPAFRAERRGVEELFAADKSRVCLLDPATPKDLSPDDGDKFEAFLFGGILGDDPPRGIVGQHSWSLAHTRLTRPDRTFELRKKGFQGRRLGPTQMTTDTAVRVTRMVVQERRPLDQISYVDFPELRFNDHESTEMPFRYVADEKGKLIMPEGMEELIEKDTDKAVDDVF